MTTKSNHTPIPWKVSALSEGKWWSCGIYQEKNNAILGEANKADAAFIVQACNSHEPLIKSINRLLNCPDLNMESLEDESIEAIKEATEALKKAKGILK